MPEYLIIDINEKLEWGRTALHLAAGDNDARLVKQLLHQGANVDSRNTFDRTPLHETANNNTDESHLKVAKLLLENGADPNARDKEGLTPLYFLLRKANVKIVRLFLKFKADIGAVKNLLFPVAAFNDNLDVIQLLINLGLNVNCSNLFGETPLHLACQRAYENIKVVKCLLKNGADINAVDDVGFTPLIRACYVYSVCKYFISVWNVMKKNFKFLLEHSDVNVISLNKEHVVFVLDDRPVPEELCKIILEHVAKLQALGITVHAAILNAISRHDHLSYYFKLCENELLAAKRNKIKNSWVSFFNLLVDNRRKLKNYAGNEDLIEEFENSDFEVKFPIYGSEMSENVSDGIKRRELYDKSTVLLSSCLPLFNPDHLIVRDIFDCILSKKDLSKFCE